MNESKGERLLKARTKLGLSRRAFGEPIGYSEDVIYTLEKDIVPMKLQHFKLFFAQYKINPEYLEMGVGDMFDVPDPDDITRVLADIDMGNEPFLENIIRTYQKLNAVEKQVIENFIYSLAEKKE